MPDSDEKSANFADEICQDNYRAFRKIRLLCLDFLARGVQVETAEDAAPSEKSAGDSPFPD
jgi:hypothetical protein